MNTSRPQPQQYLFDHAGEKIHMNESIFFTSAAVLSSPHSDNDSLLDSSASSSSTGGRLSPMVIQPSEAAAATAPYPAPGPGWSPAAVPDQTFQQVSWQGSHYSSTTTSSDPFSPFSWPIQTPPLVANPLSNSNPHFQSSMVNHTTIDPSVLSVSPKSEPGSSPASFVSEDTLSPPSHHQPLDPNAPLQPVHAKLLSHCRDDPDVYSLVESILRSPEFVYEGKVEVDTLIGLAQANKFPPGSGKSGSRGGIMDYRCLIGDCGKTVKRRDHMLNHLRGHFGVKPWICPVGCSRAAKACATKFLRFDDLKRHVRSVHKLDMDEDGQLRQPRPILTTRSKRSNSDRGAMTYDRIPRIRSEIEDEDVYSPRIARMTRRSSNPERNDMVYHPYPLNAFTHNPPATSTSTTTTTTTTATATAVNGLMATFKFEDVFSSPVSSHVGRRYEGSCFGGDPELGC